MEGPWNGAKGDNKYQYNEKELNEDFGLNWSDYGARFYDAAIGRFPTVDPLAEVYDFQSPYAYAANSPVNFIDFMGMGPESYDQDDKKKKDADGGTLPTLVVTAKRPPSRTPKFDAFQAGLTSSRDNTMGVTAAQWHNPYKPQAEIDSDIKYETETLPELFGSVVEMEAAVIEFAFTFGVGGMVNQTGKAVVKQGVKQGVKRQVMKQVATNSLRTTQGLTRSKKFIAKLIEDISKNGIKETIKYVTHNGVRYIVDGHHRFNAAIRLGLKNVPAEEVKLPHLGYKTVQDLIYSSY